MADEEQIANDASKSTTEVHAAVLALIRQQRSHVALQALEASLEKLRKILESSKSDSSNFGNLVAHAFDLYSPLENELIRIGVHTRNLKVLLKAIREGSYRDSDAARIGLHEHLVKALAIISPHARQNGKASAANGKFKVFYSWQSDLPGSCNRNLIQTALESAADAVSADLEIECAVDRDTQGLAGAPEIGKAILEKIEQAQMFVADVSIVGGIAPNPNVLFELGYAWRCLGHDSIVLVMNRAFGEPEKLPFDLRSKRALVYDIAEEEAEKAPKRKALQRSLQDAIRACVDSTQPIRPKLDPEKIPILQAAGHSIEGMQRLNLKCRNISNVIARNMKCEYELNGKTVAGTCADTLAPNDTGEFLWRFSFPNPGNAAITFHCFIEYENVHRQRFRWAFDLAWINRGANMGKKTLHWFDGTAWVVV